METSAIIHKLQLIDKAPDETLFIQIFGLMGGHLFRKYKDRCEKRILKLWPVLDLENQRLLTKYLEEI